MKIYKLIKGQFNKLSHLIASNAPIWMIFSHFKLSYTHRLSNNRQKLIEQRDSFRELSKSLQIDTDWFSGNIPTWLKAFEAIRYDRECDLKCLEIGSWQGQSAYFLLYYFNNAQLTCVDTWEGADEHKSGDAISNEILSNIEVTFDENLKEFKNRYEKYKGTSYQYFNDNFKRDKYDLVYIDGSHHVDDVIVDAVKAFEMIKEGGLLIFDDYFWHYYDNTIDNPSGAINAFLRMKKHQLKIICFDYQLVLQKTKSSIRQK